MLSSCAIQPVTRTLSTQVGLASYYGNEFQGRKTSSGEIFDNRALTAAHRTYPFGTRVEVTNVDNGESVEVRINDRGPVKPERIIDLSYAAAKSIGLIQRGIGRVRLRVIGWGAGNGDQLIGNLSN